MRRRILAIFYLNHVKMSQFELQGVQMALWHLNMASLDLLSTDLHFDAGRCRIDVMSEPTVADKLRWDSQCIAR